MHKIVLVALSVQVALLFGQGTVALPVSTSNANCPVPTTSAEFGTNKVLNLREIKGRKVRLQFFYPSEDASRRLLESMESFTTTTTTSTTTLSPSGTIMYRARMRKVNNSTTTTQAPPASGETRDTESSLEIDSDAYNQDVYCQWTFKAGNESLLSLTFEKLSAPYSDNCEQAYVALQKENGYESRWCGNRRQANARPMSLISRSSAMITVYRSGKAPLLPPTGFKVSVKELDANSLEGVEQSSRVLFG